MSIEWTHGSPDDFRRRLDPVKLFGEPVRNFFTRALLILQGLTREGIPVDRGRLRQSITFDVDSRPIPLWGKIGSNVKYAPDMEYGTNALSEKPSVTGNRPFPTGPQLETWARRHGFPNGWMVAAIIKRRGGLEPRRFLRNAFTQGQSKIRGLLDDLATEIERRWGN